MRFLIYILYFFCFSTFLHAQHVGRYFSRVDDLGWTDYYSLFMPTDSAVKKHGIFFYFPGSGETGPGNFSQAKANLYGVTRDLSLGWNGIIAQADSSSRFIHCVVQQGTGSFGYNQWWKAVKEIFDAYGPYIDYDQVHLSGVSLGGIMSLFMISNLSDTNYNSTFATVFLVSPGDRTTSINNQLPNLKYYVGKGGRMAHTIGASDLTNRYTKDSLHYAYDSVANSVVWKVWTTGDEGYTSQGHGNWDNTFKNTQAFSYLGNRNYFEWAAQYTRAPVANAQNVINTNSSAVVLNGVTKGWYKQVLWTKVSGTGGSISNPSSDTATVTGLTTGTYVYRLTVTNTHTAVTATKDVTVNVFGYGTGDLKTRRNSKKRIAQ